MNKIDARTLCLKLLHADTESVVIEILKNEKLWDDPAVWRLYGDRDNNYSTIGNQQSRPEAALVEKIVNSVDARLEDACLTAGIDPESSAAPQSVQAAVAKFMERRTRDSSIGGRLETWDRAQIQEQEQFISLAVTGAKPPGMPSLTLVDHGEGQTPDRIPDTFLSIDKNNKLRIPFVQGKFNMGGTGALKFCGTHSIQLTVSRRNPKILEKWKPSHKWGSGDPRADDWGFTVVRRVTPTGAVGEIRNSVYQFLAPVGGRESPANGRVLSFSGTPLPAIPEKNQPYEKLLEFGSVIKLFEYDVKGFGSHALQPDGLLSRLELLLPQIALPVRVHECRAYRGDPNRSFANTLVGVVARLNENPNLEEGFPSSVFIAVRNEKMKAQIYAFKGDKADSYRKSEGVIFTINGQTHGAIPKTFFDRSRVKMGRLAKSLLVTVDCSDLSIRAREDLFMNSRDRLSNGALRKAVEEELEDVIGRHPGLRELRERRRALEIAERLQDSKPLENVLESIMKSSPTLSRLFLLGQRLSKPHRGDSESDQPGGGKGADKGEGPFQGRPHPTFFNFYKHKEGEAINRQAELGRRCRIRFETDVENGYFERSSLPGKYEVQVIDGPLEGVELDHHLTPFNGIATWSVSFPEDRVSIGDSVTIEFSVTDETLIEPLINVATVTFKAKQATEGGGGEREERDGAGDPSEKGTGPTGKGGKGVLPGADFSGGLTMPQMHEVEEGDSNWIEHKFTDTTACKVIDDGEDDAHPNLSFYVNVDNIFLRTEMKASKTDVKLTRQKFVWGNVLVGLALIHDRRLHRPASSVENGDETPVTDEIDLTTRALAPFLVPMIDYLGSITVEESTANSGRGEDE